MADNLGNIIVLAILAVAMVLAIRSIIKTKNGGGCPGCSNSKGCSSCCNTLEIKKKG